MKKVNILWTGGWDSSFRVLQLSSKPISIQPYYIQAGRLSEENEIETIQTISEGIKNHPKTKCEILEPIYESIYDIPKDQAITRSFSQLLEKEYYGSQYDWLARFAKSVENLELSIHEDDKAFNVIRKFGEIIKIDDEIIGSYYILNPEKSPKDLINVFADFRFPLLKITKKEMKKWAEENGYIELMNQTWFCYKPINGEPCGICNPCIYTIEEGLEYRFSEEALKRYKMHKRFIRPIKNTALYKFPKWLYDKTR